MRKIVVIEDEEALREGILEALELEGFLVEGAVNGKHGIEVIRKEIPDLILCDILMPEMDGYQVYEQMQGDESTSLIPFIFLTAMVESHNMRKGMNLGADDYLIKPVSLTQLIKVINVRLDKSDKMNFRGEKRLNELREHLIHAIPHELRTPLHGILGYAELISSNVEEYSLNDIKSMALGIKNAGERLNLLVEKYLNYTKHSLNVELNLEEMNPVCVKDIIIEQAMSVAKKYDRVNDLKLNISSAKIKMKALDFDFFMTEIIDNAFKFSKPQEKVLVENAIIDDIVEIRITDKGRGFPVERTSEIGAFNQFDRKKFEQQGSGLGLITSKLIVQQYKGELAIKKCNPGTSVSIRLLAFNSTSAHQ